MSMTRRITRYSAYLGGDENVLALDETVLDGTGHTVTALLLVTVVAGTVELSVTVLDGLVDGVGSLLGVELPGAHTDDGHLLAGGVESNVRGGNHCECVGVVDELCLGVLTKNWLREV